MRIRKTRPVSFAVFRLLNWKVRDIEQVKQMREKFRISDRAGEFMGSASTALDDLKPLYFVGDHNLDTEVFYPICRHANSIRCMSGYFTSGSLAELAKSISYFLKTQDAPIKFIISPNLTPEDADTIKKAVNSDKNLIPLLFPGFEPTEENLKNRAIDALSFLVTNGRMIFRIAVQKEGIFHTKCWLFDTEYGRVSVHGSVNATGMGMRMNTEQIAVDKEWESDRAKEVISTVEEKFEDLWRNRVNKTKVLDINQATLSYLSKMHDQQDGAAKSADDIFDALQEALDGGPIEPIGRRLLIPNWLNYETGPYSHQGEAVSAWKRKERGTLAIATGGGKTIISLVSAALVSQEEPLLVIVAAPTRTLLNQWADEIREFKIEPFSGLGRSNRETRKELRRMFRNLRHGASNNEIAVLTHKSLKSGVIDLIDKIRGEISVMLIGDEVHNLGSAGFQAVAKDCFKYRMGLSATAERQHDDEGTKFLTDYFGPVVYDFPLETAIGRCLVPFSYHVHRVTLDSEEEEEWKELTYQIRRLSYAAEFRDGNPDKENWKILCIKRRKIAETALGKITALGRALPDDNKDIKRTLIFCSDKDKSDEKNNQRDQLDKVNKLLMDRSISYHQVTAEETGSKKELGKIIGAFSKGELQVLTAMRVLDEGFNIPQTETAYLMASNTGRRQWIQRLGRVLRLSQATGKQRAKVHDFVVMLVSKDKQNDPDLKSLIRGEYNRASFFSNLSLNGLEPGGAMEIMAELNGLLEN